MTQYKYIFINPMGVITNSEHYKNNLDNFNKKLFNKRLISLLENVLNDYNVKLVFVDIWFEDGLHILNSLKQSGFKNINETFHSFIKSEFNNENKSNLISNFIHKNHHLRLTPNNIIILDNDTQMDKYDLKHLNSSIFSNIEYGLRAEELFKLRQLIEG